MTGGGSGVGWINAEGYVRARAKVERAGDTMKEMVPLGGIGKSDVMAGIAILLASSPAGAYDTGTVIPLDSGIFGTR